MNSGYANKTSLECAPYSDRGVGALEKWADLFVAAHLTNSSTLSLEFGTRIGGSALLFLRLLERIYPETIDRPMLFTVDPYGYKPYGHEALPVYGGDFYKPMRQLLWPYENHAHWYLEGVEFLKRLRGAPYWRPGRSSRTVDAEDTKDGSPLKIAEGVRRYMNGVGFVLLDGDHRAAVIEQELTLLEEWLVGGATVIVDNTDADPDTNAMICKLTAYRVYEPVTEYGNAYTVLIKK